MRENKLASCALLAPMQRGFGRIGLCVHTFRTRRADKTIDRVHGEAQAVADSVPLFVLPAIDKLM